MQSAFFCASGGISAPSILLVLAICTVLNLAFNTPLSLILSACFFISYIETINLSLIEFLLGCRLTKPTPRLNTGDHSFLALPAATLLPPAMTRMKLCGRRLNISSDDLVCPATLSLVWRVFWLIVVIALLIGALRVYSIASYSLVDVVQL